MMGNTAKFHPLTGARVVPIGYRKDGRAIWPIMGASDDPAPVEPKPADPAAKDSEPIPEPKPDDDGKGGKSAVLADLAKERDARQALEQQVNDLKAAQQSQLDALAKALGLKSDDTPPDPERLAEQVKAEQAKARDAAMQLAVYRAAATHEANADALLDSTSFLASLKDVDPADADAVSAAIKAAVEGSDRFKVATPAPAAPSFGGGPRKPADKPDPGPGLDRLRSAYAANSK